MGIYTKRESQGSWWLVKEGKDVAQFSEQSEVDAVIKLSTAPNDDLVSAYGDGWYDGFICAQEIAQEDGDAFDELNRDDLLSLSEDAESKFNDILTKKAKAENNAPE